MRSALLATLTTFALSGVANAESLPASDAGCFGGLPASSCTYNSDCDGGDHCFEGTCVCDRECSDYERWETCTDAGCLCETRPTCSYHANCDAEGALCLEGHCYTEIAECEEEDHFEECRPEGCVCLPIPRCSFHYQCFPSLCVNDRCNEVIESCDDDPTLEEQCVYLQGCQCTTRGMDAGPPPPFDAGPSTDAGRRDAGGTDAAPRRDAGRRDGGGPDSGRADSGSADAGNGGDGGGGCALGSSSSSAPGVFLGLVALMWIRRRGGR